MTRKQKIIRALEMMGFTVTHKMDFGYYVVTFKTNSELGAYTIVHEPELELDYIVETVVGRIMSVIRKEF